MIGRNFKTFWRGFTCLGLFGPVDGSDLVIFARDIVGRQRGFGGFIRWAVFYADFNLIGGGGLKCFTCNIVDTQ